MKKLFSIIGARPQFIKHAPFELAVNGQFESVTVHTGQHYDYSMSQVFFDELKMKKPKYNLAVGSGNHGEQTARIMSELEPIMIAENPDFVIVYGDTNSTLAGALTAAKLKIPIVHIEAGLRSFNRDMPEEVNRVLTDHMSTLLFVPTETGVINLKNEGIVKDVHLIGDVMYDMIKLCERHEILKEETDNEPYCLATIHRPYNTDDLSRMRRILDAFENLSLPVKFAVHPRTFQKIQSAFDIANYRNIQFSSPLSYFDNVRAMYNSNLIITDSGGMQKEAYMLKKKCITIRSETEWMETLENGWNTLVFDNFDILADIIKRPLGAYKSQIYGDGNAAVKMVDVIKSKA